MSKTLDCVTVTNQWVFFKNISLILFSSLDIIIQLKFGFQELTPFYATLFYRDSSSSLCLNYLREQIAAKCTSDGPSPASSVFLAWGKLQKHSVFCCCMDATVNNAQCPQDQHAGKGVRSACFTAFERPMILSTVEWLWQNKAEKMENKTAVQLSPVPRAPGRAAPHLSSAQAGITLRAQLGIPTSGEFSLLGFPVFSFLLLPPLAAHLLGQEPPLCPPGWFQRKCPGPVFLRCMWGMCMLWIKMVLQAGKVWGKEETKAD